MQGKGALFPLQAGEPTGAWIDMNVDLGAGSLRFGRSHAAVVAEKRFSPFGCCGVDLAASIIEPQAWLHLGHARQ